MPEALTCRLCGGDLQTKDDGTYVCPHCGRTFVKKTEDDYATVLKSLIDDSKLERLSAARQNLWTAMHEEYISSSSCFEYARDLKSLVPSDYYANFAEIANSKNDADLSKFMNSSSPEDMETYADAVLDFMLKSLTAGTLTAVCAYIDRAYKKSSPEYVKYEEAFEREAEKVSQGVYELSMERDVFLAYSSADTGKVIELCDFLEDQGITCFLSMRNLRHGRGAADNYDAALREAMDNCRTVVFLSSKSSRNLSCDALRKELPYMRTRDMEFAPSEYKNLSYDKLPARYKKPRVEYLLDDYTGTTADALAKQIFDGVEWCKSKEEVAERVVGYLTAVPQVDDKPRSKSFDEDDIQKIIAATREREDETRSGNISDADLQKIISAVSAESGSSISFKEKEKNILSHVNKLIAVGDFPEAERLLKDLEKDEISQAGGCSAMVYFYRIFIEYGVSTDDEFIEFCFKNDIDLTSNKNYRLLLSCGESPEKVKLDDLQTDVEKKRAERLQREGDKKSEYGFVYNKTDAGYIVAGMGTCKKKELVIPSEYKGCSVIGIEKDAFKDNSSIVSVTIPKTIAFIHDGAFTGCFRLVEVINYSQLSIHTNFTQNGDVGRYAIRVFNIVSNANDRHNTSFITTDDGFMFYKSGIGNYLIGYYGTQKEITLPETIDGEKYDIYRHALHGNNTFTDVVVPDSISKIPDYCFCSCRNLVHVAFPAGVTKMGSSVFESCTSLKEIILPNMLATIDQKTFYECTSLRNVYIPNKVQSIGEKAFYGCKSLTIIHIPNSVTSISRYSFYGCSNLLSVVFPTSIKSFDFSVFAQCHFLRCLYYCGMKGDWRKVDITNNNNLPQKEISRLGEVDVYFYSSNPPKARGHYWHFDENINPVFW